MCLEEQSMPLQREGDHMQTSTLFDCLLVKAVLRPRESCCRHSMSICAPAYVLLRHCWRAQERETLGRQRGIAAVNRNVAALPLPTPVDMAPVEKRVVVIWNFNSSDDGAVHLQGQLPGVPAQTNVVPVLTTEHASGERGEMVLIHVPDSVANGDVICRKAR
jgi:hypothetical protein